MSTAKQIILWCESCQMYYRTTKERFTGLCPKCGRIATTMRCCRCGATWQLKDINRLPKNCAQCISPYWCIERVKDVPLEKRAKSRAKKSMDEVISGIEVKK